MRKNKQSEPRTKKGSAASSQMEDVGCWPEENCGSAEGKVGKD
jgi:hypothetical protein